MSVPGHYTFANTTSFLTLLVTSSYIFAALFVPAVGDAFLNPGTCTTAQFTFPSVLVGAPSSLVTFALPEGRSRRGTTLTVFYFSSYMSTLSLSRGLWFPRRVTSVGPRSQARRRPPVLVILPSKVRSDTFFATSSFISTWWTSVFLSSDTFAAHSPDALFLFYLTSVLVTSLSFYIVGVRFRFLGDCSRSRLVFPYFFGDS